MSEELKAVKVTVTPVSVFLSVCSFKLTSFLSYTVTVGAVTEMAMVRQCNQKKKNRLKADCQVAFSLTWNGVQSSEQVQQVSTYVSGGRAGCCDERCWVWLQWLVRITKQTQQITSLCKKSKRVKLVTKSAQAQRCGELSKLCNIYKKAWYLNKFWICLCNQSLLIQGSLIEKEALFQQCPEYIQ